MNTDASELMAEALKRVNLAGSFSPAEIGAKVGLTKPRAEAAARALSNAGVLVLGFDCAAHFSVDFRKAQAKNDPKPGQKQDRKRKGKPDSAPAARSARRAQRA